MLDWLRMLTAVTLVLLLFSAVANSSGPARSLFDGTRVRGGGDDDVDFRGEGADARSESSKWSSFLTVDPRNVLSILVKRGGLVIPRDAQKEIEILRQVMAVEQAQLNLVERKLALQGLTIGLPDQAKSLRVGRVLVRWDSYNKPCLDIEVDEVDVLVSFSNLMLTQSNWNELQDFGFPPSGGSSPRQQQQPRESPDSPDEALSFLRFNSIDLSKNLTVRVFSRPLKKRIGVMTVDLDVTDQVNELIRQKSDENSRTSRRGCSIEDVTSIIQSYVGESVRDFVSSRLKELATNPVESLQGADRAISRARGSILRYAEDAIEKKGGDVHDGVASKLAGWGLDVTSDKLRTLREQSVQAAKSGDLSALFNASAVKERAQAAMDAMANQAEKRLSDTSGGTMDDSIMFPDW